MKKAMILIAVTVLVLGLAGMAGAYTISDNATGGDCTQIGSWDGVTKTCTLTQDVAVADSTDICKIPLFWYVNWPCAIRIEDDGITLDGNGHTVTGTSGGNVGISFNWLSDVTVKNVTVTGTWSGLFAGFTSNTTIMDSSFENNSYTLYLRSSQYATVINTSFSGNNTAILGNWDKGNHTFEGNTFTGNNRGISVSSNAPNVLINENTFTNNVSPVTSNGYNTQVTNNVMTSNHFGVDFGGPASYGVISGNIFDSNYYGMRMDAVHHFTVSNNTISGSYYAILVQGFPGYVTKYNTFTGNTVSNNKFALGLWKTTENTFYQNNFIDNTSDHASWNSYGNFFSVDLPDGGNYWSRYDSAAEGCTDNESNGICDQPYVFASGTDYLPWAKPDGWLCQSAPEFAITSFSPESIWPPNHRGVDITVTGQVVVPDGCTLTDAAFSLTDEYGEYSASGALEVAANGSFTLTLPAAADRDGSDHDGRTYTLVLNATDDAGTAQSEPLVSTVLHDKRK
jgi:parallel beta-helix repeat protein